MRNTTNRNKNLHTLHGKHNKIAIQTYNYDGSSIQCTKYKFIRWIHKMLFETRIFAIASNTHPLKSISSPSWFTHLLMWFFISYNNFIIVFFTHVIRLCERIFLFLCVANTFIRMHLFTFFTQSSGKTLFYWYK